MRCAFLQSVLQKLHSWHWVGPLASPRSKGAIRLGESQACLAEWSVRDNSQKLEIWNWNCLRKIYFCKISGFSGETKVLSHHPSTKLTFIFLKAFFVSGSENHKSGAKKGLRPKGVPPLKNAPGRLTREIAWRLIHAHSWTEGCIMVTICTTFCCFS